MFAQHLEKTTMQWSKVADFADVGKPKVIRLMCAPNSWHAPKYEKEMSRDQKKN